MPFYQYFGKGPVLQLCPFAQVAVSWSRQVNPTFSFRRRKQVWHFSKIQPPGPSSREADLGERLGALSVVVACSGSKYDSSSVIGRLKRDERRVSA